jgi:hypothetical protein
MRPVRRADNLTTFMCRLNLLESSGPVQACNGIALPFCYVKSITYFSNIRKE